MDGRRPGGSVTDGTAPGVVGLLADLQLRALEAVAGRWEASALASSAVVAPGDVETTAAALRVLLAALPWTVPDAAPAPDPAPDAPIAVDELERLLVCTGEALDVVGEAARRAALAFAVVGHEIAAETADSLMTVALALHMLVELEGRALRAS